MAIEFRYGGERGRKHELQLSDNLLVVRSSSKERLGTAHMRVASRELLNGLSPVLRFDGHGVGVFRVHPRAAHSDRAAVKAALNDDRSIKFAGRGLVDRNQRPVVYTENLFLKFRHDVPPSTIKRTLGRKQLESSRAVKYADKAYFVNATEGIGTDVFDLAMDLLQNDAVELCHPELVYEAAHKVAFPRQWHLRSTMVEGNLIEAHAHVEEAWAHSLGEGTVIAVIDDGVDIDHPEFRLHGGVVAPRDLTQRVADPRPKLGDDRHGTACAGVACAAGIIGASGVAPEARLMPLRLTSGLGSQNEADAFFWAAENGADVISCSWGPQDGRWWIPNDPLHNAVTPLPDSTRLALDFATDAGRGGRGCVIAWAAGNGDESVDNDGYASYERVIAVAACSDRSMKSVYSDWGDAIWCAFPSSDARDPELTPGIWTTDRLGPEGYNTGDPNTGDPTGNYAHDFGGTSSACPGVAGVAALILAQNPDLTWEEVRDAIKNTCERIDESNGNYDAEGHSALYGYGRVNAAAAVSSV